MTQVKICGIRRLEDALAAVEAGADLLGFVFAPSRRRVEPETARGIIRELRRRTTIRAVGVFVNESPEVIERVVAGCGLDLVQLSGRESAEAIRALGVPVIKALHVCPETAAADLATAAAACPADILLLDTARAGAYGGTGIPFAWDLVPALDRPVLLAGGLDTSNVRAALAAVRPWGVDVGSGVETCGVKDPVKIREFVALAKGTAPVN